MDKFPVLSTGAVTQYPSGRRWTHSTVVTRFVDGSEQRFRELQQPVRRWIIRMHQLSAQEMAELEMFFDARQGEFGSFSFIDPWDGVEHSDCSFDQDTISATFLDDERIQAYLVIRDNKP
jgi:hypothetical protein